MAVRELTINQTHDPGRGSFLVHPAEVKKNNKPKKLRGYKVFFSCMHKDEPHPGGYEFISMDSEHDD